MEKYNHKKIEKKWQDSWDESEIYHTKNSSKKPKYYCLIEFPYPSGAGLHVGHLRSHIAIDIVARKKRMNGFNVMYPIGWDAFGLPTENFAIKTKTHPKIVTKNNIKNYTRQIKSYGPSFDWSREINTTDPEYFKWTQWIFLKLFNSFYDEKLDKARPIEELNVPNNLDEFEKRKYIDSHRLAYEKEMAINWCPSCKIGLANEEVINGNCERCGALAERKVMRQWMLKITKYADRLIKDLGDVDYLEKIKTQQINWIGKSEGATVKFPVILRRHDEESRTNTQNDFNNEIVTSQKAPRNDNNIVKVFTTRPDTLFGCTYMVLSPEHSLIEKYKNKIENFSEIEKYQKKTRNKSDLERTDLAKEKSGVELKGIKAINPVNQEEIPIWIADYVLSSYGTGAIMAVPAHDERDFEFAKKFGIKIREVVVPIFKAFTGNNVLRSDKKTVHRKIVIAFLKHWKEDKYLCLDWKKFDWHSGVVGGIENGENLKEAAMREIKEETGYKNMKFVRNLGSEHRNTFFARHKDENRYSIERGILFELKDDAWEKPSEEETKNHEAVWIEAERMDDFLTLGNQKLIWNHLKGKTACFKEDGVNINSGFLNELETIDAKKEITAWLEKNKLGKKAVNFKLRDWVFSRQHYWGEPIPIIKCEKCGNVSLSEKDLPLELPNVKNYEPTDTGESPLANIKKWVEVKCPVCGGSAKRETDTMPNWAGSSWYFLRYTDPNNKSEFASKNNLEKWMPIDLYNGGMEHTTLHLLYSRFWHKFLFDLGYVQSAEPYKMRRSHGMVLSEDGQKMSKSRGNVVNPDEVIGKYGADSVRLYEMFMGPYGDAIPWNTTSLIGMNRFLERIWKMQDKVKMQQTSLEKETILVATNNQGKLKELKNHLKNFNILSLKDIDKKIEEPEETGKTFEDNSLLKAKYYAQETGYMTIADDSGLCVNALNGRPGIFSSRYAEGDDKKGYIKLLKELENASDRSAYFKSVITIYNPKDNNYNQFNGKCDGKILTKPEGDNGFGYDPVFMVNNLKKSFGLCSLEEKNKFDHRKKAIDKLIKYLKTCHPEPVERSKIKHTLHKTIKKVTEDIDSLKFNTAISQSMILANEMEKSKNISLTDYKSFLVLLSPFIPHITEELWETLEEEKSIHLQSWPKFDPKLIIDSEITMVIQVNGKVRDQIKVPAEISEDDAKKLASESEKVQKWIKGKEIRKIIFIKGKLVNIVV